MNSSIMATVIVPLYNEERYLEQCLQSIIDQTIKKDTLEVLVIDDGSSDGSLKIANEYADRYPYIKALSKENEGVSSARNYGIRRAQGKYIFFLDADDRLTPETIEKVCCFFMQHHKEVDLVTYELVYMLPDESILEKHYRYGLMNKSGIYDLTQGENIYISQTTMNICVKNNEEPDLFDVTLSTSEDQKYNIQILQKKWRIGYCEEGKYIYRRNNNGAAQQGKYAYYNFEKETEFWEMEFAKYKNQDVPRYIQAQFLYQMSWKMQADVLLPYHYEGEALRTAKQRIINLLNKVDTEVIINKPNFNNIQRSYFVSQKTNALISNYYNKNEAALVEDSNLISSEKEIRLIIQKFKRDQGNLTIEGRIESPFFFNKTPHICVIINNKDTIEGNVFISSYSPEDNISSPFFLWGFFLRLQLKDVEDFYFQVQWENTVFNTKCQFNGINQPFSDLLDRYDYVDGAYYYKYHIDRFFIKKADKKAIRSWLKYRDAVYHDNRWTKITRKLAYRKIIGYNKIWIYTDCKDEMRDNGWLQFIHDVEIKDGIKRYYALNATDFNSAVTKIPTRYRNRVVRFGSRLHKFLFLRAEKVLFSYYGFSSVIPYDMLTYDTYREAGKAPEFIYLQHGVLHAHLPKMYSLDRMWIDKEVISTQFEIDNLIQNYCFHDENIIPCGMPRYDMIDAEQKPQKRILYAPSWRSFLINRTSKGDVPLTEIFMQSKFFQESQKLLNSPVLAAILEKYDYDLDVQMHRIFNCYQNCYQTSSNRIHLNEPKHNESEYSIFISDFSSYEFDFAYLKRVILYFFPDEELFKAGLNHYRKLDLTHENGFGPTAQTAEDTILELEKILQRKGKPEERYYKRMEKMFLHRDHCNRDRLYMYLQNEQKI